MITQTQTQISQNINDVLADITIVQEDLRKIHLIQSEIASELFDKYEDTNPQKDDTLPPLLSIGYYALYADMGLDYINKVRKTIKDIDILLSHTFELSQKDGDVA